MDHSSVTAVEQPHHDLLSSPCSKVQGASCLDSVIFWRRGMEFNHRPTGLQSVALSLSYRVIWCPWGESNSSLAASG